MATVDNPVLRRLRTALDEVYGERIERVVLFGSRARGDARPDSDYDVAVFLEDFDSFEKSRAALRKLKSTFSMRPGLSSTCGSSASLPARRTAAGHASSL